MSIAPAEGHLQYRMQLRPGGLLGNAGSPAAIRRAAVRAMAGRRFHRHQPYTDPNIGAENSQRSPASTRNGPLSRTEIPSPPE